MNCRYCGQPISDNSKFCPHCGRKVEVKKIFCGYCGTQLREGAKFCPHCGKPVEVQEEPARDLDGWGTLAAGMRAGSQEAFTEVYNRSYKKIFYSIRSVVRDESVAEELTQDTFIQAFEKIDQLQDDSRLLPWMTTIAYNKARNYVTSAQVRKEVSFTETEDEQDQDENTFGLNESMLRDECEANLPEAVLDREETARLMREILDQLPMTQKIAVSMFYYNDMSIRDIAEQQNVGENTVKSWLSYGRKKIRLEVEKLERQGTKLYSLAPIPFLLFLYKNMDAQAMEIPAMSAAASAAVSGAGLEGAAGAGTAGTAATSGTAHAIGAAASSAAQASATAAASSAVTASTAATTTAAVRFTAGAAAKVVAGIVATSIAGGSIGGLTAYHKQQETSGQETSINADTEAAAQEAFVEQKEPAGQSEKNNQSSNENTTAIALEAADIEKTEDSGSTEEKASREAPEIEKKEESNGESDEEPSEDAATEEPSTGIVGNPDFAKYAGQEGWLSTVDFIKDPKGTYYVTDASDYGPTIYISDAEVEFPREGIPIAENAVIYIECSGEMTVIGYEDPLWSFEYEQYDFYKDIEELFSSKRLFHEPDRNGLAATALHMDYTEPGGFIPPGEVGFTIKFDDNGAVCELKEYFHQ